MDDLTKTPNLASSGEGDFLQKEVGPLKVMYWLMIVAALIILIVIYKFFWSSEGYAGWGGTSANANGDGVLSKLLVGDKSL